MAPPRIARFSVLVSASLLLVTLGLYAPVLDQDFVYFDDHTYILDNPRVQRGLGPATLVWAFSSDRMGTWHPLTWLSHALDWELYGSDARGHHLGSLLLHALNALLLFAALWRATGNRWASFFVALVFAVHPLNVASVAWIASRKGVLSTTFWLLATWAYAAYASRGGLGRYLCVLAAFALGLLSKPMLVTLPLVLLLLDVWPLERLGWDGKAKGEQRPWLEKLPLVVMALAVAALIFAVRRAGDPVPWAERLAQIPIGYLSYLRRIVWPTGLATPYPPLAAPSLAAVLGASVLLLAITALAIRTRRQRPFILVGWLWFLVTLAPVIGLVQVGAHPMADRWTYVPMIGIAILIAWTAPSVAPSLAARRLILGALGASAVLALVLVSRAQIGYWQNTETLFSRAIAVTEGNRTAHYNLAWYLAKEKRTDEAVSQYRRAIEISPDYYPAHHNLALLLLDEGSGAEAIEASCAALRVAGPADEKLSAALRGRLGGEACP